MAEAADAQKNEIYSVAGQRRKKAAIFHIMGAAFSFALMTLFIRLSGDLPTMQKTFFRNFFALWIALAALVRQKQAPVIVKGAGLPMFMRCFFGGTGMVANFWAVDHLGIADANMLNKLSPFFAIIISFFIMKERASKVDWACVAVAFTGALFIIKPSFGLAAIPALVGLYGGFGAGTAYAYVHKMGSVGEPGPVIVFYFSLSTSLMCLPFMIAEFVPMTMSQFLCLIGTGLAAASGQFNITAAYQKAAAREISVFDYTQVIFAAILGVIFFNEIPDALSFVGYAVIIGAAVFKWRWNLRKS